MKEIVCSELPASWQEELLEAVMAADEAAMVFAGLAAMGAQIEVRQRRAHVHFCIPACGVPSPVIRPAQVTLFLDKVTLCSASSPAPPSSCS